jgi:hypothetical protein
MINIRRTCSHSRWCTNNTNISFSFHFYLFIKGEERKGVPEIYEE